MTKRRSSSTKNDKGWGCTFLCLSFFFLPLLFTTSEVSFLTSLILSFFLILFFLSFFFCFDKSLFFRPILSVLELELSLEFDLFRLRDRLLLRSVLKPRLLSDLFRLLDVDLFFCFLLLLLPRECFRRFLDLLDNLDLLLDVDELDDLDLFLYFFLFLLLDLCLNNSLFTDPEPLLLSL